MKKYKHILFDLDDTVWDFQANSRDSLKEVYENRNLQKRFDNFEQFVEIYHKHNKALWEQYLRNEISKYSLGLNRFFLTLMEVGVSDADFANKLNAEYLAATTVKTKLVDGAFSVLMELNKKYKLHVLTNGFFEVQFLKIRNSKIESFFTHIVTSEECNALKPNKAIFEYALDKIGAKAEECILIGDNQVTDIEGAQNVGVDQVFYNPNQTALSIEKKPTYEVKHLKELIEILK